MAAPSAGAVPDKNVGNYLGAMWKKVLETPTPQNPPAWASRREAPGREPLHRAACSVTA